MVHCTTLFYAWMIWTAQINLRSLAPKNWSCKTYIVILFLIIVSQFSKNFKLLHCSYFQCISKRLFISYVVFFLIRVTCYSRSTKIKCFYFTIWVRFNILTTQFFFICYSLAQIQTLCLSICTWCVLSPKIYWQWGEGVRNTPSHSSIHYKIKNLLKCCIKN